MKKSLLLLLVAVVLIGVMAPSTSVAQRKNVTFLVNTASVPDTINTASAVYITGGTDKGDTVLNNWGLGVALTNIGGDYWKATLPIQIGDTIHYKLKIYGGGWEENTVDGNGNRNLGIAGAADTTLPVQFWNNGHFPVGKNITLYDKPYSTLADSFVNVYVRVNIQAVRDQVTYGWTAPDKDSVCIMGGGPTGSNLDWGTPLYLTPDTTATNSGTAFLMDAATFYHATLRIPKSAVTAGQDVAYKFRLGSNWNYGSLQRSEQNLPYDGGNRHFTIPVGKKDTTLQWVWFGNTAPIARANPDTCVITFRVSLAKAISKGGFSIGDTVQVQSGWFATAVEVGRTRQLQQVAGSIYQFKDTIITKIGANLDYQYYLQKLGKSIRESYYNFNYSGTTGSEAERRQVVVPATPKVGNYVTFTIYDTATTFTSPRRTPEFLNGRKLARKVRVTYTVDVRPAYYTVLGGRSLTDGQGTTNITPALKDSIFKWGVWINGPGVGGWGNSPGSDWNSGLTGNPLKKMYDDGTHGDAVAGDSVYTLVIVDSPDSVSLGNRDIVGQEFKFGIRGGDNEGGSGGYGNNHYENIVDTDTLFTIASQFGSINPAWYNGWDFDNHKPLIVTGVVEVPGVARVYTLEQNYPNPFNPSTKIAFGIPVQAQVSLKVYNVLGQEVATLVNENLKAGNHVVSFDASHLASGVYFYKVVAGNFVSTKKMLLLK